MKKQLLFVFAAVILAMTATAVAQTTVQATDLAPQVPGVAPGSPPAGPNENQAAIADSKFNNQFALDIYAKLSNGSGNLFFSPISLRTVMALAYAGAKDQTASQIATVFHFDHSPHLQDAIKKELAIFGDTTSKDTQVQLSQGVWIQKGYKLKDAFKALIEDIYSATVKTADFTNPEGARSDVNSWVKGQTNEKLTELIPKGGIDKFTKIVLASAVYFKGKWVDSFENQDTKPRPFFVSKKASVKIPMMYQRNPLRYAEDKTTQMMKLGYVDGFGSMLVLLPKKKDGLKDLEKKLTLQQIDSLLNSATTKPVDLILPKIHFAGNYGFGQMLKQMGIVNAFDPLLADFTNMIDKKDFFISRIFHTAWLGIDEEGTEAAAASALAAAETTGLPPKLDHPVEFHADHPFLFMIVDDFTGSILFMGRFIHP